MPWRTHPKIQVSSKQQNHELLVLILERVMEKNKQPPRAYGTSFQNKKELIE
jgi:hypothetical protein